MSKRHRFFLKRIGIALFGFRPVFRGKPQGALCFLNSICNPHSPCGLSAAAGAIFGASATCFNDEKNQVVYTNPA